MPVVHSSKSLYNTKEACERIGRSKSTVLSWIAARLEQDVARDEKDNRVWTDDDIERFTRLREKLKENRRRKRFDN